MADKLASKGMRFFSSNATQRSADPEYFRLLRQTITKSCIDGDEMMKPLKTRKKCARIIAADTRCFSTKHGNDRGKKSRQKNPCLRKPCEILSVSHPHSERANAPE